MHLSMSDELHSFNMEEYEKMRFAPVLEEARVLKQEINTFFKATVDVETDITDMAEQGD
jgi:phosphoglycerate-specific signal transduction histidine kinase